MLQVSDVRRSNKFPQFGDIPLELAAVRAWASANSERQVIELQIPTTVVRDSQVAAALLPQAAGHSGIGHREIRIAEALIEGTALLRSAAAQAGGVIQTTLSDYDFVRGLLCSACVKPNREACEPLALDMVRRANVYMSIKFGNDQGNPFWVEAEEGYRRSGRSSSRRGAITRRELADLGNVNSRLVAALLDYLRTAEAGLPQYSQMGCAGEPLSESSWRRFSTRQLARRLRSWSGKQVRTHFERLQQRGLVAAERLQANGPWQYVIPEELENVQSPYFRLPTIQSSGCRDTTV